MEPIIFYSGNTVVRPGNAVVIRGEYLDEIREITVSDGKSAEKAEILQGNRQSFKFIIPNNLQEGVFTLKMKTADGEYERKLNIPVVRWVQGDEGKAATPGGWIRINGECLRINSKRNPYFTLKSEGKRIRIKPEKIYDDYSIGFLLPKLDVGEYKAEFSNGYSTVRNLHIIIAPSPEESWRKKVYNVVEEGIATDQVTDVTDFIRDLLKKVDREGGGVVYFPRGRYHVTGTFDIPSGTVIRGDGYTKTQIFWTDVWNEQKEIPEGGTHWSPTRTPDGMLKGKGNFAIEDIDFAASRIGSFIIAGDEDHPADNVRIDNTRIYANAFSGWYLHSRYGAKFHRARSEVLLETMMCRTDMISICGENIKIRGCDFQWSARPFAFRGGLKYLLMQNNKFGGQAAIDDWMPLGRLENSIVEDCEVHEWISGCSGTNIYYARVKIQDVIDNDRESFTTDISYGTPYHGPMYRIKGNSFTFPKEADFSRVSAGKTLVILSGKGAGQYRRIKSVRGRTVVVDKPFEVQPDMESHLTVNDMFTNWYFVNNSITNGGSLQLYTAQCNTVVDGTKFTHSASIKSWGQEVYDTISCQWYISFVNNRLSDCNYYHYAGWYMKPELPGASFLCCFGEGDDTTNIAMTIRNNSLEYNGTINMRGGVNDRGIEDLVIDSNRCEDARCAIYLEGKGDRIFISNNEFVSCDRDIEFTDENTRNKSLIINK